MAKTTHVGVDTQSQIGYGTTTLARSRAARHRSSPSIRSRGRLAEGGWSVVVLGFVTLGLDETVTSSGRCSRHGETL